MAPTSDPFPMPQEEVPAHILIVEDNILQRLALAEWLRDKGYTVLEASSTDEASVMLASALTIHLVVTDIWLPGLINGLDFARYVRRAFPHIHLITTSGIYSRKEMDAEQFVFFQKPYKIDELSEYITKILSGRLS